ncbi:MAG: NapC/NirT family cytochrome c [Balneolaceae bacterium]|nr:NapC/NirT family cytochrome c [Balneolaceae bacterium]
MKRSPQPNNLLFKILAVMISFGVLIAAAGVYFVDTKPESESHTLEEIHEFDMEMVESRSTIYGAVIPMYFQAGGNISQAPQAEKGFTVGELMRWAGIISITIAVIILLMIEFFYKKQISRLNYRTLMMVGMFALPVVVVLSTGTTVLETTKTVESCASCHVMDPFVNDLFNPESNTLAARHYKNRWISEYQCYTCHTTYGAHGTFEGKRDGFRHWLLYVTQTWEEPIAFAGSYPNQNCTACHGGTQKFMEVVSHQALSQKMRADEVSCTSCHGPAHPTPGEREDVPDRELFRMAQTATEISAEELTNLVERFYE